MIRSVRRRPCRFLGAPDAELCVPLHVFCRHRRYQIALAPRSTTSCSHRATTSSWEKRKRLVCGHSVLKLGAWWATNWLFSRPLFQMLRLGFNCGTWAGKQRHYRQNSDALVSGRVVNSSHNTSVYTADTEPATFAPLPCSH